VATTFSSIPGWKIRGTTRNPDSETAKSLVEKGFEIVKADLDDKASLTAAFQGANAIFAVTDFWQHFSKPENHALASKAGKTINEYAFDLEVAQGINIADAAADASVVKTLDHFVFSSLANVRKWSKGKYTWVYHFDSKAKIEDYIINSLPQLAATMSTVQIGYYVTNWKSGLASTAPQKQSDGSYTVTIPKEFDNRIPFVVTHRDTGPFVKALVDMPPGKNLLGVSEMVTWEKWVETWGKALGVKANVKRVLLEEYMETYPSILKEEVGQSFLFSAEFGWTGGDPNVLTPDEVR
jgi:hypothetical protein